MEKFIKAIKQPWTELSYANGARRMKKFLKKNEKDPVEEKHPMEKRFSYTIKKFNNYQRRKGVKIKTEGKEYLPKGAYIVAPNLTNAKDYELVMAAMGEERNSTVILDDEHRKLKGAGYLKGINAFFRNEGNKEQVHSAATSWAKSFNRALIFFPESKASQEVTKFSVEPFELAKKFFMPIVPVTIKGSRDALSQGGTVNITFHRAIKPMQITTQKPERVSQLAQNKVESAL